MKDKDKKDSTSVKIYSDVMNQLIKHKEKTGVNMVHFVSVAVEEKLKKVKTRE